jgi:hypothetical protein
MVEGSGLPFRVQWDLVQLSRFENMIIGVNEGGPVGGAVIPTGADVTLYGQVTIEDAATFLTKYAADRPAADINNDDIVDVNDVVRFSELYSGN